MRVPIIAFVFAVLITAPELAHAAAGDSGEFINLLDLIKNSSESWDGALRGYATSLFWSLAGIQLVWQFSQLLWRGAEIGEIVGELFRFVMVIGFFAALLQFSRDWSEAIVNSFREAGAAAGTGGSGMSPSDVFASGIDLAVVIGNIQTLNPATAFLIALAGLIVLICFAFIAAFMAVTIVESYIIINAGVLFMGFGGSQWTRDFALSALRYCASVGAKLFVMTLIIGLIVTSTRTWASAYTQDNASMWTMVGLSLICAYISKTIPDLVGGLISGASTGGGSAIGGMAAAAMAGAAAAAGAMVGSQMASSAAKEAAGSEGAGGTAVDGLASLAKNSAPPASMGSNMAMNMPGSSSAGGTASNGTATAASTSGGSASGPRTGGHGVVPPPKGERESAMTAQTEQASASAAEQSPSSGESSDSASSSADQQSGSNAATSSSPGKSGGASPAGAPTSSEAKKSEPSTSISTAEVLTRGAGILSAMSVPGMEGAAGVSLNVPPAPQIDDGAGGEQSADEGNTIRPATSSTDSAAQAQPAASPSAGMDAQPAEQWPASSPDSVTEYSATQASEYGAFEETALSESDAIQAKPSPAPSQKIPASPAKPSPTTKPKSST